MAADSESLFSLDTDHVSEELGFILPDPLVGGKAQRINVLLYLSDLTLYTSRRYEILDLPLKDCLTENRVNSH